MHGLINRSIECFLRDLYGHEVWASVASAAEFRSDSFEAVANYDDALTDLILAAASQKLGKPVPDILEDIGTYLVSHQNRESLRRLLRFGGATFIEFLHSLDELHERAKLAVPDLDLPVLELCDHSQGGFTLFCGEGQTGFDHVLVGVLRAMADDYGALVLLEYLGGNSGRAAISIQLLETRFAQGKTFDLTTSLGAT